VLRVSLFLVLSALPGAAAPACLPGSLSDYLALTTEGCMLGTRTVSDFELGELTAGSELIPASSILVTPSVMGLRESLLFTSGATAPAGSILESVSLFRVQTPTSVPQRATLTLAGAQATPDAVVLAIADLCFSGEFTGGTCTGMTQSLLAVVTDSTNVAALSLLFGPVAQFQARLDAVLDAGLGGTATLTSAELRFETVPEPSTVSSITAGILAVLVYRRVRQNR
jgi:hypothetical protein